MRVVLAAGAHGVVEDRRPGAGVPGVGGEVAASRSWRLTAQRNPLEVCLPDWRVTGVTPASPASDSGSGEACPAVAGLGEQPRGAHGPGAGQGGEDARVGMGGQLGVAGRVAGARCRAPAP